jgi:hypothetical protein
VKSAALRQHRWLIHAARPPRSLVHFLEEHDVRSRVADDVDDALEVVDPSGILPGVYVVDDDANCVRALAIADAPARRARANADQQNDEAPSAMLE